MIFHRRFYFCWSRERILLMRSLLIWRFVKWKNLCYFIGYGKSFGSEKFKKGIQWIYGG